MNPTNVEEMVREMLNYLIVASADNRPELCKKIMVGRRRDRGFRAPACAMTVAVRASGVRRVPHS